MSDELILYLAEAEQRELVGGKAYALGEMIRAGFLVPKGFVLSVNAFLKMTPSLQALILNHFDALETQFVAVRSSAINEDGTEDAWAGQLETYLNCSRDNLLANIKDCWESADSKRAQSYAEQKGIEGTKVAVIVQEMIQSDVSGVAFSVHPISNDATQIVIEAGLGLGEAIVSGHITPDTYIVAKKTGEILETHISKQTKQLVRNKRGETVWKDAGPHGDNKKLTTEQVKALSRQISRLETFFAHPVDIEWAIFNGNIYVLQSRPITTLTTE